MNEEKIRELTAQIFMLGIESRTNAISHNTMTFLQSK